MKTDRPFLVGCYLGVICATGLVLAASIEGAEVTGYWITAGGRSTVLLSEKEGELCGYIHALKEPRTESGELKTDRDNPDPSLRSRPLTGILIIWGFHRDEAGEWEKGRIYDPENGRTYHASITLDGDTLILRGSLDRWGMLGRTVKWTRKKKGDT